MSAKRLSPANVLSAVFVAVILVGGAWAAIGARRSGLSSPERAEPLPSRPVSIANGRTAGKLDAPVVLIEFSDFQCPACGSFARTVMPELTKEYVDSGRVLMVFMHLPLPMHPHAVAAAEAAECAGEEGHFWDLHDVFFQRQREIDSAGIRRLAHDVGLNSAEGGAFDRCLAGAMHDKVAGEADLARELGVSATPTFFFGRMERGSVRVVSRFSGTRSLANFGAAIAGVSASIAAR